MTNCNHVFKTIQLFTSSIEECIHCNKTSAEINCDKKKSDCDNIATKPEGLNSGTALKIIEGDSFKFWGVTYHKYFTDFIPEQYAEIYKNVLIFGNSQIKIYPNETISGLSSWLPPTANQAFFGIDRSEYPYRFTEEYKPEPEEEPINVTKSEFMEAVKRAQRANNDDNFVENVWTEMFNDYNGEPEDE